MNIVQPSRVTFWRFVLGVSSILPFLSLWQAISIGRALGVDIPTRPSWMGVVVGLSLLGLLPLLAWTLTWSSRRERILALTEFPERAPNSMRWTGWILLLLALVGYTAVFSIPFIGNLFGMEGWIRVLVFWYFGLMGMYAIKTLQRDTHWFMSLLAALLIRKGPKHAVLFIRGRLLTLWHFARGFVTGVQTPEKYEILTLSVEPSRRVSKTGRYEGVCFSVPRQGP